MQFFRNRSAVIAMLGAAIAAAASAWDLPRTPPACWDIAPANEIISDPTDGASCWGLCTSFNDWVPGTTCSTRLSSGSQDVVCQQGTVHIDQFGTPHCQPPFSRKRSTVTVAIPQCGGGCTA